MEVKIVKAHEPDVKEMTVEDVAKFDHVGILWKDRQRVPHKFLMSPTGGGVYDFIRSQNRLYGGNYTSPESLIERANSDVLVQEIHVFDTEKELYLWMAE